MRDKEALRFVIFYYEFYVLKDFFTFQFSSFQSLMSNSLRPHESQHARPSC